MDARAYLQRFVGREIFTLTGRPNRVLELRGEKVIVATQKSPKGQPVPIKWVQDALDALLEDGEITIDVETVGYRSAFIGAVVATLRDTEVVSGTQRVRLKRSGR